MGGASPPLTPAAAAQLANLAVSSMTQTIPVSVASTVITMQMTAVAQPEEVQQEGTQDAQQQQQQQTPTDQTRRASAPTLRIPLDVQQTVAEIVHPRAVAALNNLDRPKEPGTAQSKDDADRQKFSAEVRGRNVDLAAIKATYDMEYEDAVEKLGRAKADPAVAAVLSQVP